MHGWVAHAATGGGMTPGLAAALTASGMLLLLVFVWTIVATVRGLREDTPRPAQDGQGVARRCAIGCANWPDHDDFDECLECGEPPVRIFETPMDSAEARSRKRRAEFERLYGPAEVR